MRLLGFILAVAIIGSVAALTACEDAGAARAKFLVPTSPSKTGFGPFKERAASTPAHLKRYFGAPARVRQIPGGYFSRCLVTWPRIGVTASFTDYPYGPEVDACSSGYFQHARLTDRRWHTGGGIRPGSSEDAARKQSRARCASRRCRGRNRVVLGFHMSACDSSDLRTGVAAILRNKRVASLVVYSNICPG